MYDLNFFSIYKKRKSKSKGLKIFIIVFVGILILANALIFFGRYWLTNSMQNEINTKESQLKSQEILDKVTEAERITKQAALVKEYLKVITEVNTNLKTNDYINRALFEHIQSLIPLTSSIKSMAIEDVSVRMSITSTNEYDSMDIYHILNNDPMFHTVTLSNVVIGENGTYTFDVSFILVIGG